MRSDFSLNHVLRGVEIPKSREECGIARQIVLITMILVFLDNYIVTVTVMFTTGGPTYKLQFSVVSVVLLWHLQVGAKKRSPASKCNNSQYSLHCTLSSIGSYPYSPNSPVSIHLIS